MPMSSSINQISLCPLSHNVSSLYLTVYGKVAQSVSYCQTDRQIGR